jgi:hypothetical protein
VSYDRARAEAVKIMDRRAEKPGKIPSGAALIVDGFVTFAFLVLAWLAFDDITTDNATSFTVEYTCLLACAIWCLVVAVRLAAKGHFILGTASALALGAAVWGQRSIGPGTVPSWQPQYVATAAAIVWFVSLAVVLVVLGFRTDRARSPAAR